MINKIFSLSQNVRYVAIYRDGKLETRSREGPVDASGSESDRYEELLVNPTLLTMAAQRGNIDCGGLEYLIIRYGNFFQFVLPTSWGHVSVCIEKDADPVTVGLKVKSLIGRLVKPFVKKMILKQNEISLMKLKKISEAHAL